MILGNPLGLLALLGIPAVLLIHFLQRQSRTVTVSTLFLLDQLRRQSDQGRRIERLRNSVPLWLQLLMVLLLTWLLVQPRWLRQESVQPIAVVLDNSASMSAYRDEAVRVLPGRLRDLARLAAITEFSVLTSDGSQPNLYRGRDIDALTLALQQWRPRAALHDFEPALRVARSTVGHQGVALLVTDHVPPRALPYGARHLAVGSPQPNAGFAGLRIEEKEEGPPTWNATVRNYSDEPQTRTWRLVSGTSRSPEQTLQLGPGQIRRLSGSFPPGTERCRLELASDDFPIDDVLPMIQPQTRALNFTVFVPPGLESTADALLKAVPRSFRIGLANSDQADLFIRAYDPLNPGLPPGPGVVFLARPPRDLQELEGFLAADDSHPLMTDLNWMPLRASVDLGMPLRSTDRVLLWAGDAPLIFLRRNENGDQRLVFNFYLPTSNADRLPAFVLLVNRFAEAVRATKPTLERRILETNQRLPERALGPAGTSLTVSFEAWDGSLTFEDRPITDQPSAPAVPGFLTVKRDGEPVLEGSTYFADTREADLRKAATGSGIDDLSVDLVERNTEADINWTLWLLILGFVLIASWAWHTRRPTQTLSPRAS